MTMRVATEAGDGPCEPRGRHHGVHLMNAVDTATPSDGPTGAGGRLLDGKVAVYHRRRVGNGQGIGQGLHP